MSFIVDAVALFTDGAEYELLDRAQAGDRITEEEAYANDRRQAVIAGIQTIVFFTTAVCFLAWFRRAYPRWA